MNSISYDANDLVPMIHNFDFMVLLIFFVAVSVPDD